MKPIYLDHAASTPVHPEVAAVMYHMLLNEYGNASSVHQFGRSAKRIINGARDRIAGFLGCSPEEWVFTSGGTESDNLALFGAAYASASKGRHIITTAVEHHAVLHTCAELEGQGFEVTYLPVDSTGRVSLEDVESALREDTVLISIMYVNNEVGTVQPIEEIGRLAAERGVLVHVDAVQALGTLPLVLRDLPVDYMSFSAHKIGGPQGIGGLYVRRGRRLCQDSMADFRSAAGGRARRVWLIPPGSPEPLNWLYKGCRVIMSRLWSSAEHCWKSWTSRSEQRDMLSTEMNSIRCLEF